MAGSNRQKNEELKANIEFLQRTKEGSYTKLEIPSSLRVTYIREDIPEEEFCYLYR